ncbi:hypothetical protein V1478_014617 [Vespula squamosa]|uniref:Uncharacterized protein n=1 Tax=Vespula squamosa TaxID=30214 RepID=A0ABD2A2T0_VESSQ
MPGFAIGANTIFHKKKFRTVAPLELRGKREEAYTVSTDFHINASIVKNKENVISRSYRKILVSEILLNFLKIFCFRYILFVKNINIL